MLAVLLLAGLLPAQEVSQPAPLVYAGKPLAVVPACRPEDLSATGLACTEEEPCELYLELSDAEVVANRIILAGNLHTSAATLESVLLASEDGGRTWAEAHARIPAAGLDKIQFIDFENGWISGETLLALPRDPFFLLTSDGGRTWRRRPVFSESRVGMVEAFWFDTRTQGSMTIDRMQSAENGMRYELYESLTGGESWSLRQIAERPIALKRPKAPESSIRLRTDAASRSYRVERRAGERWESVAAFAVAAGHCKPPARPPQPEPQMEPEPPPASEPAPAKPRRSPSLRRPN